MSMPAPKGTPERRLGVVWFATLLEQGFSQVSVESDCEVAVKAITSAQPILPRYGHLVRQCQELLCSVGWAARLKFVRRSGNLIADALANYALDFNSAPNSISILLGLPRKL